MHLTHLLSHENYPYLQKKKTNRAPLKRVNDNSREALINFFPPNIDSDILNSGYLPIPNQCRAHREAILCTTTAEGLKLWSFTHHD